MSANHQAMSGPSGAAGRVTVSRDGPVATVTLINQDRLNAITVAMWRALDAGFRALSSDTSLRCIVVRGAAGQFAAGADIREFPQVRTDLESTMAYHRNVIAPALDAIETCMHPIVAAIEGVCVGGGLEIASCCDLRIAARNARFGAPINRLGFPMAPDEMRGLLRLAGHAVTLEILLEGRVFDADEAMAKGLLTRVVDGDNFENEIRLAVSRIVAGAPLAARLNKRLVRQLQPCGPVTFTDAQWRQCFSYASSSDHRRGIQAFLDGRDPIFTGD